MATTSHEVLENALAELAALARRLLNDIREHGPGTARTRLVHESANLSDAAIGVLNRHDGLRVLVELPPDDTEFEHALRALVAGLSDVGRGD